MRTLLLGFAVLLAAPILAATATTTTPSDRFREANELARSGQWLKATLAFRDLAISGAESASLYWNWAQAAAARSARGEALWALLRARELDPGDRAVAREVEKLRESLNLDDAEIATEPLAATARIARRFRLDWLATLLLAFSVISRVLSRVLRGPRWSVLTAGTTLILGLGIAAVVVTGSLARPTAVVVRFGAPLLDAASPTAETLGSLREGEVVPVLETSGDWLRVEDGSGARGWAHVADVQRLDLPPHATGGAVE